MVLRSSIWSRSCGLVLGVFGEGRSRAPIALVLELYWNDLPVPEVDVYILPLQG